MYEKVSAQRKVLVHCHLFIALSAYRLAGRRNCCHDVRLSHIYISGIVQVTDSQEGINIWLHGGRVTRTLYNSISCPWKHLPFILSIFAFCKRNRGGRRSGYTQLLTIFVRVKVLPTSLSVATCMTHRAESALRNGQTCDSDSSTHCVTCLLLKGSVPRISSFATSGIKRYAVRFVLCALYLILRDNQCFWCNYCIPFCDIRLTTNNTNALVAPETSKDSSICDRTQTFV